MTRVRTRTIPIMSPSLAAECREVIADYAGVRLTEEQFATLIDKDLELKRDLIRFNSPRDTVDREQLMGLLAKEIVGRDWPCYGDGPAVAKQFHLDFERLAKEKGYELVDPSV